METPPTSVFQIVANIEQRREAQKAKEAAIMADWDCRVHNRSRTLKHFLSWATNGYAGRLRQCHIFTDKREPMIVRISLVLAFLAVTGCAYSNFGASNPQTYQHSPTPLALVEASDFDPIENVVVVEVNEREASVIADYIGLTSAEAVELAKKQGRHIEATIKGGPRLLPLIFATGRILITTENGIVTNAEFPQGVDQ